LRKFTERKCPGTEKLLGTSSPEIIVQIKLLPARGQSRPLVGS
jgi:hypothetical protein